MTKIMNFLELKTWCKIQTQICAFFIFWFMFKFVIFKSESSALHLVPNSVLNTFFVKFFFLFIISMCGSSLDLWIPRAAHSVSFLFFNMASKPYSMLTVSVQQNLGF